MSKLRQTVPGTGPSLPRETAYYSIYGAVQSQPGLCHGQLHDRAGAHCAIGSLWDANPKITLEESLIDEVAAVNDSVPHLNKEKRKAHVLRWLRWKLDRIGIKTPGRPSKVAR